MVVIVLALLKGGIFTPFKNEPRETIPQYQIHLGESIPSLKMHTRGAVPLLKVFFSETLKNFYSFFFCRWNLKPTSGIFCGQKDDLIINIIGFVTMIYEAMMLNYYIMDKLMKKGGNQVFITGNMSSILQTIL